MHSFFGNWSCLSSESDGIKSGGDKRPSSALDGLCRFVTCDGLVDLLAAAADLVRTIDDVVAVVELLVPVCGAENASSQRRAALSLSTAF
jgi:hypothetical protein